MCAGKNKDDEPFPAWDEQVIKKALENIYYQKINVKTDIEPNLFEATWQTLNLAIDKGFGKIDYEHPDAEFVYELRHNAGLFAAFKVHRQQNDLAARLVDENGRIKSFTQWSKEVQPIADHYNKAWLQTEYSTAIMRARQAAQWRKYERDADLFPNLKWLPSTSIDKREGHVPFYGLVKPINDKFWQKNYPGNLWNCKCGITNTNEPLDFEEPYSPYKPSPGLDINPKTGNLFNNDTSTYRSMAYDGAEKASENAVKEHKQNIELRTLKTFANGGKVSVYQYLIDPKKKDYIPLRRICEWFAENKSAECVILPRVHHKSRAYKEIFGKLIGTKYERKCPDLLINGEFYEYESYESNNLKRAFKDMIKRGMEQSDKIIIKYIELPVYYMNKYINAKIHEGKNIKEVLMFSGKDFIEIFKMQKPDE